jgi:hypothetical protein
MPLSVIEGRVLGCLLEKERTVPDQYPLSGNAVLLACNQSTSRHPVMALDVAEVDAALMSLKEAGWVIRVLPGAGSRVMKFKHRFDSQALAALGGHVPADDALIPSMQAAIGVLLLRGPQTVAEIRSRTERMFPFSAAADVDAVLAQLAEFGWVNQQDRTSGTKEPRWQQLIAEEVVVEPRPPATGAIVSGSAAERIASLETDVAALSARIARLERQLADLLDDEPSS